MAPAQSQRDGGLVLPLVHRQQTRTHDLGHIGGLVQREADDGEREVVEQILRLDRRDEFRERNPQRDRLVNDRHEAPEDELHVHRGTAKQPQVHPRDGSHDRVRRQPHHGNRDTQDDRDDHGVDRQLQRDPGTLEDAGVKQVLAYLRPVEDGAIERGVVDEQHGDHHDHHGERVTPGVAQLNRLDRLGCRVSGGGRGYWPRPLHPVLRHSALTGRLVLARVDGRRRQRT